MRMEENKTTREKISVTLHNRNNGENKNQIFRGRSSKGRWIRFAVIVFCGLVLFARLSWILFQRPVPVEFDSIIVTEQRNVSAQLQAMLLLSLANTTKSDNHQVSS